MHHVDCCAWHYLNILSCFESFDNHWLLTYARVDFGDGAAGHTFCVAEIGVCLVRHAMSELVSLVLTHSVACTFDC